MNYACVGLRHQESNTSRESTPLVYGEHVVSYRNIIIDGRVIAFDYIYLTAQNILPTLTRV
jgi:hypothetical protein